ncbi:MAG: DUF1350 family protein [Cyanobacteria bacterium P01_G01_bin.67]
MVDFDSIKGSNTKVAFHPQPKGVIQLIGGFPSGSFPEKYFRFLLQHLYDQGYSLLVYSFPFNPFQFNHWSVALESLEDLYQVRCAIINQLFCTTASQQQLDFYTSDRNYFWLGYSLGCKYILLLEILGDYSDQSQRRHEILESCLRAECLPEIEQNLIKVDQARELAKNRISELLGRPCDFNPFIRDQPSLLLAPEINNTFEILNLTFSPFKYFTFPSQEEIQCLINNSTEIFNLMGLISFQEDTIASDDVDFLVVELQSRSSEAFLHKVFPGQHDAPLVEFQIDDLAFHIDHIFQELRQRCC